MCRLVILIFGHLCNIHVIVRTVDFLSCFSHTSSLHVMLLKLCIVCILYNNNKKMMAWYFVNVRTKAIF